jgi:hypothetical protein
MADLKNKSGETERIWTGIMPLKVYGKGSGRG